jgi:hypothetical protein
MRKIVELLAGLGFFLTGTDPIYNAITNIDNNPYSQHVFNPELVQIILIGIGFLLFVHVFYEFVKENIIN